MLCTNCENIIPEGERVCQNCSTTVHTSGFNKTNCDSFNSPEKMSFIQNSEDHTADFDPNNLSDYKNTESIPSIDPSKIVEMARAEAEKTNIIFNMKRWADKSLLFGILSICFIAIGAGLLAIFLPSSLESNRTKRQTAFKCREKRKRRSACF